MDLITVVIPAFNAEHTIGRCLDSIIRQSYEYLEIIVVDDGSLDGTRTAIQEYAEKDRRIQWISQKNQGVSAARNTGIRHASGRYLLFADADDYMEWDMLETLHHIYQEHPDAGLAVCGYDEIVEGQTDIPRLKYPAQMSQVQFLQNIFGLYSIKGYLFNKLFRMDRIKDRKLQMNEEIYICEDLLFCCQYGLQIDKVVCTHTLLYHYVRNAESATHRSYSPKRLTAVLAFETIKREIQALKNPKLEDAVNAHYIIICLQLFKRLFAQNKNCSGEEMRLILSVLRKMDMNFLVSEWPLKYKAVYFFLKCMLLFKRKE